MTGLILHDFLAIRKTILYMVVMILLFGGIYSFMDNDYFVTFFVSIMMVSVLISTISYDEFYHWDRYAAILPLSRRQIVGAKYLTTLLLFGGGMLLTLALQVGMTALRGGSLTGEQVVILSIAPLIGLIGVAVVLPCCFRFGVQQSRIIMMALYGVPTVLLVLVMKFFPDALRGAEWNLSPGGLLLGLAALTAAALGISFPVTVGIVERKELK